MMDPKSGDIKKMASIKSNSVEPTGPRATDRTLQIEPKYLINPNAGVLRAARLFVALVVTDASLRHLED